MKNISIYSIVVICCTMGTLSAQTFYPNGTASIKAVETSSPSQTVNAFNLGEKGNFMIGSGIGFSTATSKVNINASSTEFNADGGSSSLININPNIGYFFANNFAFGVGMDFIASRTETPQDAADPNSLHKTTTNSDVLFGPFARFYFPLAGDKAFFIGSSLGFGSSRDEFAVNTGNQIVNNNLIAVGIGPGFTIFSKDGLALEALMKYNYARSRSDIQLDNVQRTSTTFTNAFDFSIGIQYYFGGFKRITP